MKKEKRQVKIKNGLVLKNEFMDEKLKNSIYRKLSREYLLARKKFRDATDKDRLLSGNDNIVGRIGEFVVVQFLKKELKRKNVERNESPVQKGYDIIADGKRVSVKTITAENTSGRTTFIKQSWDEFVLVELGGDSRVLRIGYITNKDLEIFRKSQSRKKDWCPVASRSMFHKNGIFSQRKRKILEGVEVKDYL